MALTEGLISADPNQGCFLCDPEEWRVLFIGQHTRVIAGLGPLCPGYVLVAPSAHVPTIADLAPLSRREFNAVCEVVIDILESRFGPGFTAYEHGKLGSCLLATGRNDTRHFCFHAHRVFIPMATDLQQAISRSFQRTVVLPDVNAIDGFRNSEYVYYESGTRSGVRLRTVFLGAQAIPSQYMRRVISSSMSLSGDPSWMADLKLADVIATAGVLGSELSGLWRNPSTTSSVGSSPLPRSVSLDGSTCSGKSSLAQWLRKRHSCSSFDSGLAFRRVAAQRAGIATIATDDDLVSAMEHGWDHHDTSGDDFGRELKACVNDETLRSRVHRTLMGSIRSRGASIVIGRDAWKCVPPGSLMVDVTADTTCRARRWILRMAESESGDLPSIEDLRIRLRRDELATLSLARPIGPNARPILDTSRRSFQLVCEELTRAMREVE